MLVTDHLSLKYLQGANRTLSITCGKDNVYLHCMLTQHMIYFFFFYNGIDQMEQWQEEKNKQCIVTGLKLLFGE